MIGVDTHMFRVIKRGEKVADMYCMVRGWR